MPEIMSVRGAIASEDLSAKARALAGAGRAGAIASAWLLAMVVFAGCMPAILSGGDEGYEVTRVSRRGPYLDAVIRGPDEVLRFYFPDDETCRATVAAESRVEYLSIGRLGRVRRAGQECEAIGVASLRAWLKRRPRPRAGQKPRAQAAYRLLYEDSEVFLARGQFPLAGLIGWSGASDVVAVLPRTAPCQAAIESGGASMEFSALAQEPFWLLVANERCPIKGFVVPLGSASER